uniref:MADF domain-containing protein n=2 Tax=Tetraodon nigroviridis TaxID=99883 RepID=H3D8E7_TETNG
MESKKLFRSSWTEETLETLVELWREHPCLYDVSHELYQNRDRKEECWREVAAFLQKPVEDVKTRALSLRTQYSRLVRPKPGGHGNKVLTTKQRWILGAMEFIRPHIVHRPSETKVAIMFGGTHGALSKDELEKEREKGREKEKHHRPSVAVSNVSSEERKLDQEVGVHGNEQQTTPIKKPEPNPAESVSSSLRDEDELFLLSLLPSIKRLTNKKRMEVRMKFQQVLYAAEFEDS